MEQIMQTERSSSISLSRTSKGVYSWDIKLYYDADKTAPFEVIKRLESIDNEMKGSFKGDVQ